MKGATLWLACRSAGAVDSSSQHKMRRRHGVACITHRGSGLWFLLSTPSGQTAFPCSLLELHWEQYTRLAQTRLQRGLCAVQATAGACDIAMLVTNKGKTKSGRPLTTWLQSLSERLLPVGAWQDGQVLLNKWHISVTV